MGPFQFVTWSIQETQPLSLVDLAQGKPPLRRIQVTFDVPEDQYGDFLSSAKQLIQGTIPSLALSLKGV